MMKIVFVMKIACVMNLVFVKKSRLFKDCRLPDEDGMCEEGLAKQQNKRDESINRFTARFHRWRWLPGGIVGRVFSKRL
jgi:hypothetical protein